MLAINQGYEGNAPEPPENSDCRICIYHFHSSVINCDDNGIYSLKNGAAPTLNLSKFSMENESYKEEKSLSRIVESLEDLQYVYEYEIEKEEKEK